MLPVEDGLPGGDGEQVREARGGSNAVEARQQEGPRFERARGLSCAEEQEKAEEAKEETQVEAEKGQQVVLKTRREDQRFSRPDK